ncbi:MAG: MFS transporter [Oligoflexales bacterium]|nr:MFS transporter [Oligoflexales bacterium]
MIRSYASLLIFSFISYLGVALPFPVLAPMLLSEETWSLFNFFGLSGELMLGLTLAIYPLGKFVGAPWLGSWSDQIGRRKVLLLSATLTAAGHFICFQSIILHNFSLLIASRFFTGLWEGNIGIARAAATDLVTEKDKPIVFGYLNAAITSSYIAGPLVGGYFADHSFSQYFGSHLPFLIAASFSLVCFLIVFTFLPETLQTHNNPVEKIGRFSFLNLENKALLPFLFICFLFTLSFDSFFQFFPLYMVKAFQFKEFDIGLASSILTVAMVLTQAFFIRGLKSQEFEKIVCLSGLSLGGMLIIMLLFKELSGVFFCLIVIGFFIGILETFLPTMFSNRCSSQEQGKAMGQLMSLRYLGDFIICLGGGSLASYGASFPIYMSASIVILAVAAFSFSFLRIGQKT